ncbi:HAD family hydrolase [Caproicibacter sp.]|uniref:HAD family hydrolase n=1 Tax=Caproicibacter sp. TaxID=2814884 RepID=UPI0039890708
MFRACIFDLDGTLLDTLPTLCRCCNASLAHFSLSPVSAEQCRGLCRLPIAEFYPRLLQLGGCPDDRSAELVEPIRQYDLEIYLKDPCAQTSPFPGIPELLRELRRRGTATAVLTNKPAPLAEQVVSSFFPGLLNSVAGQTPDTISKPDPRSLLHLIQSLSLSREECLFVGDTDVDMRTARAAGVPLAAVAWGYQDPRSLSAYEPDWIVRSPEELLPLFIKD